MNEDKSTQKEAVTVARNGAVWSFKKTMLHKFMGRRDTKRRRHNKKSDTAVRGNYKSVQQKHLTPLYEETISPFYKTSDAAVQGNYKHIV